MTIGLREKTVTELLPALESHDLEPGSYLPVGKATFFWYGAPTGRAE